MVVNSSCSEIIYLNLVFAPIILIPAMLLHLNSQRHWFNLLKVSHCSLYQFESSSLPEMQIVLLFYMSLHLRIILVYKQSTACSKRLYSIASFSNGSVGLMIYQLHILHSKVQVQARVCNRTPVFAHPVCSHMLMSTSFSVFMFMCVGRAICNSNSPSHLQ